MKFSLVLIYCLFPSSAISGSSELDKKWDEFKTTYEKSYSAGEEPERKNIFEKNLNLVEQHNAEADRGLHSYRLKINHMSDMTDGEMEELTSCYFEHGFEKLTPFGDTFSNVTISLPRAVDWRAMKIVTPVKSQGQCGSCWAFATVGALESHLIKKTGKMVTLSEQNLVDCAKDNYGCRGGTMSAAFQYIAMNKGIDTDKVYPYEAKEGKCRFSRKNVGGTCKTYACIHKSEDYVKKVVATIGPVSTSIYASEKKLRHYGEGVYSSSGCNKRMNHAVLIVGYGEEGGEKYWIIKNSWNTHWGMNGFMYLKRDAPHMCGVATISLYPIF